MFIVLDKSTGLDAVQFAQKLNEKGVETRPFFLGMHEQPIFQTPTLPTSYGRDAALNLPSPGGRDRGRGVFTVERYPVAERIARKGLYLPSGLTHTETHINFVCDMVKTILEN